MEQVLQQTERLSEEAAPASGSAGPLSGVNVLDFGHTVMGPACGLMLADLGATVIRVEPTTGDPTRRLQGFGSGFFGFFNRNKSSIAIDLKDPATRPVLEAGLRWADVLIENFAPGTMHRLGLGSVEARAVNPRLVYCALKGFLPGPYDQRPALDEVVQMMGGLAYMTGPPGRPLRAGASVVDITGGMFGVIGILAALRARDATGQGAEVTAALYETTAFLVGQHMAMARLGGTAVTPMPERTQAWGVYDLIDASDGQVFVGITSDGQWTRFCATFGLADFAADPRLATNRRRVNCRGWMLPRLREDLAARTCDEISLLCVESGVPVARVNTPLDLFEDAHLNANGSLLRTVVGEAEAQLPALPVRVGGQRPSIRQQPQEAGAQTREAMAAWGVPSAVIEKLMATGSITAPESAGQVHQPG